MTITPKLFPMQVTNVQPENAYRYSTNPDWIGSFGYRYESRVINYDIVQMEFEHELWLDCIYLGPTEVIWRCQGEKHLEHGTHFFLKYDTAKNRIYFNSQEAQDAGKIAFETAGIPLTYLNLLCPTR